LLLISLNQLQFTHEKDFQDNKAMEYSNLNSHSRLLYSAFDELPIASIILHHYFIPDTIITEMKISYLGTGFQNETNEHISIAGAIENVTIEVESKSVEFQLKINSQINQSDIFYTMNELIPKGQYFILELQWEQTISIESSSTHNISVYWNKRIGISVMKVILGPGYSYVSATNPPDQVKPETNELVLRWTEILKESFTCSLLTLYEEPYFEEGVSITPLKIEIVENENNIVYFTINIENVGNSTLQVKIISGDDIRSLNSSISLIKPLEKLDYVFEGNLTKQNFLESNITFQIVYFNGSQLIFHIPVDISIQNNLNPLLIVLFVLIASLTLAGSFFAYKKRDKIQQYYSKKKRQGIKVIGSNRVDVIREQESKTSTLNDQNLLESQLNDQQEIDVPKLLNKYKIKLKNKELEVFEVLLRNPFGHSQAELCELTGISKATMSRIVSQLELLQLVDREKSGMSKIVKVKNKIWM
jgi:hypothetical protein